MGDLSEHYNKKDFICKCSDCKGEEYRIHLGLVGALEFMGAYFKKIPQVLAGFWCEEYNEKVNGGRKSSHIQGKAVHFRIEGIPLNEVFKYVEANLPEAKGIGYYPDDNFIHIDSRKTQRELWVKEKDKYSPLTEEKRRQYNL